MNRNSLNNLLTPEELNARLTPEQRKANTSKAGLASAEARKERNRLKDDFQTLLDVKRQDGLTVQESLAMAITNKALKGDVKAAEFIRDTVEGKPTATVNVQDYTPVVLVGYDEIEE